MDGWIKEWDDRLKETTTSRASKLLFLHPLLLLFLFISIFFGGGKPNQTTIPSSQSGQQAIKFSYFVLPNPCLHHRPAVSHPDCRWNRFYMSVVFLHILSPSFLGWNDEASLSLTHIQIQLPWQKKLRGPILYIFLSFHA